jgi:hypothetical protein
MIPEPCIEAIVTTTLKWYLARTLKAWLHLRPLVGRAPTNSRRRTWTGPGSAHGATPRTPLLAPTSSSYSQPAWGGTPAAASRYGIREPMTTGTTRCPGGTPCAWAYWRLSRLRNYAGWKPSPPTWTAGHAPRLIPASKRVRVPGPVWVHIRARDRSGSSMGHR